MTSKLFKILIFLMIIGVPLLGTATEAAAKWSPLMEAAFKGDMAKLKKLLTKGADINDRDNDRSTPLMVAASQGHAAIVRELLARGADINVQNKYGWTPLMLATAAKHTEIIKLLLSKGADPEISKQDGSTAFTIAESVGLVSLFTVPAEKTEVKKKEPDRLAEQAQKRAREQRLRAQQRRQRAEEEQRRAEEKRQGEVRRLLALADGQMKVLRLTQPAGDNAYESYRQVLALDPGNAKAQAGFAGIAKRYEELAQGSKRKGELQKSLSYVERGLKILPENAALLGLREEIQTQLADADRKPAELVETKHKEDARKAAERAQTQQEWQRREISRLLALAERQLKAARLRQPAGDNAYASYREVLALDSDNAEARAGLAQIAAEYEKLAQARRDNGALQESLLPIEKGLEVMPDHAGLLALRQDVRAELAEQEKKQREIARLLDQAERQLKTSRLTQPEGDNAYASYRQVLALDSDNAEARAGFAQIAAQHEKLARKRRDDGALPESLSHIDEGLQVMPDHAGLLALRKDVAAELAAQEKKQREIARLLDQAERQLKTSRLTQPEGDNAYATYRQVLALEPDNAQAKAGFTGIAAHYEKLARAHRDDGALPESLSRIEQGLQIMPEHAGLLALRQDVAAELAAQEKKQREIAWFLAQAERQLKASQLMQPEGDNAYASYRQVLALDPGNAEAKAGLVQIAAHYERLARAYQDDGALQESLSSIAQGLQVMPEHTGLLALRQDVAAALAEQGKTRREIARLLARAERQLKASPLPPSAGDNAYASYRQVLKLDPGNAEAKAGLVRLAVQYGRLARKHQGKGALRESLSYIEKSLKILPQNAGLLALREEVQTQLAEARRKAAELAEAKRKEEARKAAALAEAKRKEAERERRRREMARKLAKAQQVLREKREDFDRIERALDAEEQTMRLSIQQFLEREWKPDPPRRNAN